MQVTLLGDGGEVLEVEPAPVGLALGPRALHEDPPAVLQGAQAASARSLAWRLLAAHARVRFHAVFPVVPIEAARFRLEAVPIPEPVGMEVSAGDASEPEAPASAG